MDVTWFLASKRSVAWYLAMSFACAVAHVRVLSYFPWADLGRGVWALTWGSLIRCQVLPSTAMGAVLWYGSKLQVLLGMCVLAAVQKRWHAQEHCPLISAVLVALLAPPWLPARCVSCLMACEMVGCTFGMKRPAAIRPVSRGRVARSEAADRDEQFLRQV